MRGNAVLTALALLATSQAACAKPVQVRLQWIGNDGTGGVLVSRVRELLAASPDKRETFGDTDGLSVIVQTLDPAVEWQDGIAAQGRLTVYSLTISQHDTKTRNDSFAGAVLGYCALADLASCAREIVDAMDEQIVRRAMR